MLSVAALMPKQESDQARVYPIPYIIQNDDSLLH